MVVLNATSAPMGTIVHLLLALYARSVIAVETLMRRKLKTVMWKLESVSNASITQRDFGVSCVMEDIGEMLSQGHA